MYGGFKPFLERAENPELIPPIPPEACEQPK